jgi:hypothetical protein
MDRLCRTRGDGNVPFGSTIKVDAPEKLIKDDSDRLPN